MPCESARGESPNLVHAAAQVALSDAVRHAPRERQLL